MYDNLLFLSKNFNDLCFLHEDIIKYYLKFEEKF